MSSPGGSPAAVPTTPDEERNITINKENTAQRTPLPNAPVNGADKVIVPVEVAAPKNAGEVVLVPGTAPPPETSTSKSDEAQKSGQVNDEQAKKAEEPPSDSEAVVSEDTNTDLPAFNWNDLQRRYSKALQDVNKQEDEIMEEFEKFSSVSLQEKEKNRSCADIPQAFSIWGQASANRDNDRASKRLVIRSMPFLTKLTLRSLRTREKFVRLEEISLDAKKKHCK
jgi:hypothetical protein